MENVGVEDIAMGRGLHWDVSPDISDLYIGQIRRLEKNIRFVTQWRTQDFSMGGFSDVTS